MGSSLIYLEFSEAETGDATNLRARHPPSSRPSPHRGEGTMDEPLPTRSRMALLVSYRLITVPVAPSMCMFLPWCFSLSATSMRLLFAWPFGKMATWSK